MHIKFPSIESFHNVRRMVTTRERYDQKPYESITYRGKIKLHGTNAGVQIQKGGRVRAQSRTRIIDVGCDNAGFAAWVAENEDTFSLYHNEDWTMTVFGEWCGEGIMKGTALNLLDKKYFVIFALQIEEDMIYDPKYIMDYLPGIEEHDQILIMPWQTDEMTVHWRDNDDMKDLVDEMNKMVDEIDNLDPWVKGEFGKEGNGEGLVFYPIWNKNKDPFVDREWFSDHVFKAKGEKHKVTDNKKAVILDPETVKGISEFVDKTVTINRLEQGVREVNRGEFDFDTKLIGPFIGWVSSDVKKETVAELEESGLEWKKVAKEIS